jgi:phage tail sheath protein FI
MGDFEREFGGLDRHSEASYAIQQFFLNGGQQAWVVRVGANAKKASAKISYLVSGTQPTVLTVEAISPGEWGNNLSVRVDKTAPDDNSFNLTITETITSGGRSMVARQEIFRELTMTEAELVVNDATTGSKLVTVKVDDPSCAPLANGTYSGELDDTIGISSTNLVVTIGGRTKSGLSMVFPADLDAGNVPLQTVARVLENTIRAALPADPTFSNATVSVVGMPEKKKRLRILAGGDNPYARVSFSGEAAQALHLSKSALLSINAQAYKLGEPTDIRSLSGTAQINGVNGNNGSLTDVSSADISTALIGNALGKTGIHALENVDLFNLLCIPRTSMVGSKQGLLESTAAQAVMSVAIQYCRQRRAFFIMDTPSWVNGPAEVRTWLQENDTLRDHNAALFFPRVKIPDPLNKFRLRSVGASGTIAGLFARIDKERGVWKAPAGAEASLRNVAAFDYSLTDPENGALNPLAINGLRSFPIYGNLCWGARTLKGSDDAASEWKYVPVRRLALFIEESLFRGLKWVVFEPNDEPLWGQIRLNVGAFMQNLFRKGAFQGSTPREAYLVKCDRETTTQNDINLGIVNIVVGFAPLKPAEFVIIKLQQLAGQIEA